jgi:hypothetical protein
VEEKSRLSGPPVWGVQNRYFRRTRTFDRAYCLNYELHKHNNRNDSTRESEAPITIAPTSPSQGRFSKRSGTRCGRLARPDVEAVAKDLELYAGDEPPPEWSLDMEIDGVLPTLSSGSSTSRPSTPWNTEQSG